MKLITKYLVSEILRFTLAISLVLLFILLSNQFIRFLSSAAADTLSADVIKWILFFQIPSLLALILSVALYLGIIFLQGNLLANHELVILRTAGLSNSFFTKINGIFALFITIIVTFLTFEVNPKLYKYIECLTKSSYSASMIKPKRFNYLGKERNWLIYIDVLDKETGEYRGIFIKELSSNCLITAKRARITKEHKLTLLEGNQYCGDWGKAELERLIFQRQDFFIRPPKLVASDESGKSMYELWQHRHKPTYGAEIFWRVSAPLMVVILALVASSLNSVKLGRGKYSRLGYGILIYVFYLNGLFMVRTMIQRGTINFGNKAFLVHEIILFLTGFIFWWFRDG